VFEQTLLEQLFAVIAGLLLGSFLNVCIYRWPNDLSVMKPSRSFCPNCERQIAWFDNIPVLSYLLLRARCRHCHEPISWRYPLVEVLTALSFWWFVRQSGFTPEAFRNCVFAFILVGLIFSDFETMLLPDELTLGGTVIGLAFSLWIPAPSSMLGAIASMAGLDLSPRLASFAEAAVGAAVPSFLMWLMGYLFEKLRKKEGLGFGDVKMVAMIGAFVGITGTLQTVILASVAGSVIGLLWLKLTRQSSETYQPFGSFLGAAALVTAAGGQTWFWKLLGGE
jgi:leader peptidase (prepilin peptidase)/N-methyltransferase